MQDLKHLSSASGLRNRPLKNAKHVLHLQICSLLTMIQVFLANSTTSMTSKIAKTLIAGNLLMNPMKTVKQEQPIWKVMVTRTCLLELVTQSTIISISRERMTIRGTSASITGPITRHAKKDWTFSEMNKVLTFTPRGTTPGVHTNIQQQLELLPQSTGLK